MKAIAYKARYLGVWLYSEQLWFSPRNSGDTWYGVDRLTGNWMLHLSTLRLRDSLGERKGDICHCLTCFLWDWHSMRTACHICQLFWHSAIALWSKKYYPHFMTRQQNHLGNFLKVTKLLSYRARVGTQVCQTPKPFLHLLSRLSNITLVKLTRNNFQSA